MNRYLSTMVIALVCAVISILLTDVACASLGDGPIFEGYLAVIVHAIGFALVWAATVLLRGSTHQPSDLSVLTINHIPRR